MHEARFRADMLGEAGQERDDVVLDLALDGVDAVDVESAALADRLRRLLRDDAEFRHRLRLTQSFLARKESEYLKLRSQISALRKEVASQEGSQS